MTAPYDLRRIRRLLLLLPAAARASRNDRGVPLAEAARLTGARSAKQVIEDVDAVASLWVDPGEAGEFVHLYDIADGGTASTTLEALLLGPESIAGPERKTLRKQLLAYCERDTFALVKLTERLAQIQTKTT